MMMQSWMGSDFTNDDLVRESSIVKDYTHKLLGEEIVAAYSCYKVELIPLENAPVVWGKVLMWVSKKDYLWLKAEFYDEDDILVSTEIHYSGLSRSEFGGQVSGSWSHQTCFARTE